MASIDQIKKLSKYKDELLIDKNKLVMGDLLNLLFEYDLTIRIKKTSESEIIKIAIKRPNGEYIILRRENRDILSAINDILDIMVKNGD